MTHIVDECSDNKSLSKVERKRIQIEHSAHISTKAKLVKIADKISNNKSLVEEPIWPAPRILGYGIWSNEVFQNIKGVNEKLDNELHDILGKIGVYKLSEEERKRLLE